jgi:hypothetical protein
MVIKKSSLLSDFYYMLQTVVRSARLYLVLFFVLCGDGLCWSFPIPSGGCGGGWFFGLGCFSVCVGMG